MKIAIVITELLIEGGGERQCVFLARELQNMGHTVTIFTLEFNPLSCFPDITSKLDIRTVGKMKVANSVIPGLSKMINYYNIKKLAGSITNEFEVLNPHAGKSHLAAMRVKKRYSIPVVWMCNDFLLPLGINGAKNIINIFNIRNYLLNRYDIRNVRELDKVVVLDNKMKQKVENGYGIVPSVVRSGVDIQSLCSWKTKLDIKQKFGIQKDTFLILCVSILLPHRRMEDVIDAINILIARGINLKLLLVGSLTYHPEYSNFIVNKVKSMGLEKYVIFAGEIPEQELIDCYHCSNVFVFPNENQTWGLAVIEAMACGLATIVSTGCGAHEVLEDRKTALLVPPRSPEKIAESIEFFIENPNVKKTIAVQGQDFVKKRLSWKKYSEEMLAIYEMSIKGYNNG